MNKLESVKIWTETKKKLDELKVIPDESYDSILTRILNSGTVKVKK